MRKTYRDKLIKLFYKNGYGGNATVCPECNVDDFVHVEGCKKIGNDLLDIIIRWHRRTK